MATARERSGTALTGYRFTRLAARHGRQTCDFWFFANWLNSENLQRHRPGQHGGKKYFCGIDQYISRYRAGPSSRWTPPPGAWPLEESLLATHIEPAEHAPLALGGIEISLLPSPFGLPPGIRTTAMQTVGLCDLGARVDGFVGRPCPSRGGRRGLASKPGPLAGILGRTRSPGWRRCRQSPVQHWHIPKDQVIVATGATGDSGRSPDSSALRARPAGQKSAAPRPPVAAANPHSVV